MRRLQKRAIIIAMIMFFSTSVQCFGICEGTFVNPFTDMQWNCILPIKIGGMNIMNSSYPDPPDCISGVVCVCPIPSPPFIRIGMPFCWWKARRLVELVKDPYCFPSLGGISFSSPADGKLAGGYDAPVGNQDGAGAFQQAHFLPFFPMDLIGAKVDSMCFQVSETGADWLTEFDVMWNDDEAALLIMPEAKLFANAGTQISCMADSAAANTYLPIPAMHWCMGSWGSTYPLTGHVGTDKYITASAAMAGRMIFKMSRELGLLDSNINHCFAVPAPIWIKWHFRLQIVRPAVGGTCMQIGQTSLIWGVGQNAPYHAGTDNFTFLIFQKQCCCALF